METQNRHSELFEKKKRLQRIADLLKEKFIGLDSVIDEIMSLMMPWYLFPEAQLRPTIINMWGLTGSGKTALIQSMVELLEYTNLYTHMDMGEFESNSSSWAKNIFTEDLDFFHQKSVIVCLDEFQFARTIDGNGNERGRDKLRAIWELLDSGKMYYNPISNSYYLLRADACLERIEKLIVDGVIIKNGVVCSEEAVFMSRFNTFYFDEFDRHKEEMNVNYFNSRDFVDGLYNLYDEPSFTKTQLIEKIKAASLVDLRDLILNGMKTRVAIKQLDLSRAVIFVLGNLDEAYTMSGNMNPDISADEFYEATSKITIATIKNALRKRFRSEQIARLGNNHIIYTSFKNAHFRELISRELNRIGEFVKTKFGWTVSFDSSVIDIVYAEGVFPAQGTRPLLTTIKNLIESRVSKVAMEVVEQQCEAPVINWMYQGDQFIFIVENAEGSIVHSFSDEVKLKIDNLRKSTNKHLQAHTAVHEAGHAVLAALTLRILPSVVVSKTAADDCEGFCLVNFPEGPMTRDSIRKDIIISLGGYAAEKLIFGDQYTSSGVSHDIEIATELANKAIRKFAMGTDPVLISVESANTENHFYTTDKYNQEAMAIIKSAMMEAETILERNKLLLLKMSEYLTLHPRMEEKMIGQYVRTYSKEEWVCTEGFVTKEEYYQFYHEVVLQLKELENQSLQKRPDGILIASALI